METLTVQGQGGYFEQTLGKVSCLLLKRMWKLEDESVHRTIKQ